MTSFLSCQLKFCLILYKWKVHFVSWFVSSVLCFPLQNKTQCKDKMMLDSSLLRLTMEDAHVSLDNCVVCTSSYGFWIPLLYSNLMCYLYVLIYTCPIDQLISASFNSNMTDATNATGSVHPTPNWAPHIFPGV